MLSVGPTSFDDVKIKNMSLTAHNENGFHLFNTVILYYSHL